MNTTCCEKCQLSSAEPERGIYQAWCNNKNCPCHKSAEKLTAVNNSSDGQIHIPTVFGEAPTDESWSELYLAGYDCGKSLGIKLGKSEAFSLVRKMVRGATDLRDPKTQIYKIINAHDFLTKLSTLEGN